MVLLTSDPKANPLITSEYEQKFPAKRLTPGSSISLIAALHLRSSERLQCLTQMEEPGRIEK